MPVIPAVVTQLSTLYGHATAVVWPAVTENDICGPIQMQPYSDRSVHAFGTFGGASVAVQGTNEATNDASLIVSFVALHDAQGTAIAFTTAKIDPIAELCNWMKPVITGGAGQSLTVAILCRSVL